MGWRAHLGADGIGCVGVVYTTWAVVVEIGKAAGVAGAGDGLEYKTVLEPPANNAALSQF